MHYISTTAQWLHRGLFGPLPLIVVLSLCARDRPARAAQAGDEEPLFGEPGLKAAPATVPVIPVPLLLHDAVTEGKQGSTISITVGVENDPRFEKLVLAYRPEGAAEFLGRDMREVGSGSYAAEIPATATMGATVAYFIEAQDKEGYVVAARGSAESPFVIGLAGSPAAAREKREEEEAAQALEDDEGAGTKLFVGVLLGSGTGWATGHGDLNADVMFKSSGPAWAQLGHLSPEIGIWISRSLMLSLQGRFQKVTGTTDLLVGRRTYHAAGYAAAAFGKATWLFGRRNFHPTFSLAVGVGQIRHVVTFDELNDCGLTGSQTCVDTIAAGPILAGAGSGFMLYLDDRLTLVVQVNSQVATPNFALNVDLNAGLGVRF